MKSEIIAIFADLLEVSPEQLDEYKTLQDLNIDSLDFIEIMYEIEKKFDVPATAEMQRHRDQIHNLGDVLRLTEELIAKRKEAEPIKTNG
jgi:acyl carrier protein